MIFQSGEKFRNSFSLWFESSCSLSLRRDFLKVSGRLKFSRSVKNRGELARMIFFIFYFFYTFIGIHINVSKKKKNRRKFSIVVASRAGENFRSWWWRWVSSPLQVSGAVTRLTVDRAASHNTPSEGGHRNLQRRGYYSVSSPTSPLRR